MLAKLVTWILNTYIGELVEDLNMTFLTAELLKGNVVLNNLQLKRDALKKLDLPVEIKTGFVERAELKIPIRSLKSEQWIIILDTVYAIAGPISQEHLLSDCEAMKQVELHSKKVQLKHLEENWLDKYMRDKTVSESENYSWFSYAASFMSNIGQNLLIQIKNVHLRFEDGITVAGCPFACGIVVDKITLQSTDCFWQPTFIRDDHENVTRNKIIDFREVSLYWDANSRIYGGNSRTDLDDYFRQLSGFDAKRSDTVIADQVSAQIRISRCYSDVVSSKHNRPRLSVELNVDTLPIVLSDIQLHLMTLLLAEIHCHRIRRRYLHLRPTSAVQQNAARWWKFAIEVHVVHIRQVRSRCQWDFVLSRARDNVRYVDAYRRYLVGDDKSRSDQQNEIINACEENMSFDEILTLREVVYRQLISSRCNLLTEKFPEPLNTSETHGALHYGWSWLRSWFPEWSECNTCPSPLDEDVTVQLPKTVDDKQLEQEVYDLLTDYSDTNASLYRDVVKSKLAFNVNRGTIVLTASNVSRDVQQCKTTADSDRLFTLNYASFKLNYESRPSVRSRKFCISMDDFRVTNEGAGVSEVIALVQRKDAIIGDAHYSIDNQPRLLNVVYEHNCTMAKTNHYIFATLKPLSVVFSPVAFHQFEEFLVVTVFGRGNVNADLETMTTTAVNWFNKRMMRVHDEMKRILEDAFHRSQHLTLANKWSVDLDISVPCIVIPDNVNDDVMVLDLGNLQVNSLTTELSHTNKLSPDADDYDLFVTPLSTPPSEDEGNSTSKNVLSDADNGSLLTTSTDLSSKLYEMYRVTLSGTQVIVCKLCDNWELAYESGASDLHVLDKTSLNIELKYMHVNTSDPSLPKIRLECNILDVTVHLNESVTAAIMTRLQLLLTLSPVSTLQYYFAVALSKWTSSAEAANYKVLIYSRFGSVSEEHCLCVANITTRRLKLEVQHSLHSVGIECGQASVNSTIIDCDPGSSKFNISGQIGTITVRDLSVSDWRERLYSTSDSAVIFDLSLLHRSRREDLSRQLGISWTMTLAAFQYIHDRNFLDGSSRLCLENVHRLLAVIGQFVTNDSSWSSVVTGRTRIRIRWNIALDNTVIVVPANVAMNEKLIVNVGKIRTFNSLTSKRNATESLIQLLLGNTNICLLDAISFTLSNIDVYFASLKTSALRGFNTTSGNSYPFFTIHQHGQLLKHKCHFQLKVRRDSKCGISFKGTLSSVHCTVDKLQLGLVCELVSLLSFDYMEKLIRHTLPSLMNPQSLSLSYNIPVDKFNVSIEVQDARVELFSGTDEQRMSLAAIDILAVVRVEFRSDGSYDVGIFSRRTIIRDTRYSGNCCSIGKNVFTEMFTPSSDYSSSSFQLEFHCTRSNTVDRYQVVLNKIRFIAVLDWIATVTDFLLTSLCEGSGCRRIVDRWHSSNVSKSVPVKEISPLTCTHKIIEINLNVINSKLLVMSNPGKLDTDAVMVLGTAVLSYYPLSEHTLSCNLSDLTVSSCSMNAEDETALNILEPMSVTIELTKAVNVGPVGDKNSAISTTSLNAENVWPLEINFQAINIRLSQNDIWLLLSIINSLRKTFRGQLNDSMAQFARHIGSLPVIDMGQTLSAGIQGFQVYPGYISFCLIDDCHDNAVALVDFILSDVSVQHRFIPHMKGRCCFQLQADHYNQRLSGWEPFIEKWDAQLAWMEAVNDNNNNKTLTAEFIGGEKMLDVNVTVCLVNQLTLYIETMVPLVDLDQCFDNSCSTVSAGRACFVPFIISNCTGCSIEFAIVSETYRMESKYSRTRSRNIYSEWQSVKPDVSCPWLTSESMHRRLPASRNHQLLIRIAGWKEFGPIPIGNTSLFFWQSEAVSSDIPPARILVKISAKNSMRKTITIGSSMMLKNDLKDAIEIKLLNSQVSACVTENECHIVVASSAHCSIPLDFVNATMWLRPLNWSLEWCQKPIKLTEQFSGETVFGINSCGLLDAECDAYRFNVSTQNIPFKVQQNPNCKLLPAFVITISSPFCINSLLPVDMKYTIMSSSNVSVQGTLKSGEQAHLAAVNVSRMIELKVVLDYFPNCQPLIIQPEEKQLKTKISLRDSNNRMLELLVTINRSAAGSLQVFIGASCWLVNKTGLPLAFRQVGSNLSVQHFVQQEIAQAVTPFLQCFSSKVKVKLLSIKLDESSHGSKRNSHWCKNFILEKGFIVRQLEASASSSSPGCVYEVGITVRHGRGRFTNTTVVIVRPRFVLINHTTRQLAYSQCCAITADSRSLSGNPKSELHYHWSYFNSDHILCLRLLDKPSSDWSGGFRIDKVNSFQVSLKNDYGDNQLLGVNIGLDGATFAVEFVDVYNVPSPYRVDNFTSVPIHFQQAGISVGHSKLLVSPGSSAVYVMDEPNSLPCITLAVGHGSDFVFDMGVVGECSKLYDRLTGVGDLFVTVRNDGPTRVLQITDTPIGHKDAALIDWGIVESTSPKNQMGLRTNPLFVPESGKLTFNLELKIQLPAGGGISLMDETPEELVYATFRCIVINYNYSLGLHVLKTDIYSMQMDNQQLNSRRPEVLYVLPSSQYADGSVDRIPAFSFTLETLPSCAGFHSLGFKNAEMTVTPLIVHVEEQLLWKIATLFESLVLSKFLLRPEDSFFELDNKPCIQSVSKQLYFGAIYINVESIICSLLTSEDLPVNFGGIIKQSFGIPLARFEDAELVFKPFSMLHQLAPLEVFIKSIMQHYIEEVMSQVGKVVGSADFIGSPLSLLRDIGEARNRLREGNVGGLIKNVTHGISNSAAKVSGSASYGVSMITQDKQYQEKRQRIMNISANPSDEGQRPKHFRTGLKSFVHGVVGGVKSIPQQGYRGAQEGGFSGFVRGIGKGAVGSIAKPVTGFLDMASGAANAICERTKGSQHQCPDRVRRPRSCKGHGGLLVPYSDIDAKALNFLLRRNKYDRSETLLSVETLRASRDDELKVLVSSNALYFLSCNFSIEMLFLPISELINCERIEEDSHFYIELFVRENEDSLTSEKHERKRIIQCDTKTAADLAVQSILSSRKAFDNLKIQLDHSFVD